MVLSTLMFHSVASRQVPRMKGPNSTSSRADFLGDFLKLIAPNQVLGPEEMEAMRSVRIDHARFPSNTVIKAVGDDADKTYVVRSGWGCSQVDLPDGSRQIADFQIRGDIIGLRGARDKWDEALSSISHFELYVVPTVDLNMVLTHVPSLAAHLIVALARNSAIRGERLVDIGRRSALVRTAHLLLELGTRLGKVGLASEDEYDCPLTQKDLADALGLTPIHVNRTLAELRRSGLVRFQNGRVVFLDRNAMIRSSDFRDDYL